jgi:hypothetical protein
VRAAAKLAGGWYWREARRQADADPDNTLRLGAGGLKKFKAEVSALSENALGVASEILSDPAIWWHLSGGVSAGDYFDYIQYDAHVPELLDRPVRRILGKLAEALERYGYLEASRRPGVGGDASPGEPFARDGAGYSFQYALEWSEEMRDVVSRYRELYEAARRIMREKAEAEAEEKRVRASALWDSV